MLEGTDVLADRSGEVLTFDEVKVLPSRVTEYVAEGIDAAAAFDREINIIG